MRTATRCLQSCISTFLVLVVPLASAAAEKPQDWAAEAAKALPKAGDNRGELEKALKDSPAEQRVGMEFLIANMPERDLKSLRADFLLKNHELAYKARKQFAWGAKIPEELFLNNVLPYANVDEERDAWRKEMYELCAPIVKDCKTPGEAAHLLNTQIFGRLKVRYSTERKKAQQNPTESIANGTASCTGLSILLSDACRSVGVPTRIAGTPLWSDKRGNHTWVEIWDGEWHFTGACEADPKGLDRGWFVGDAAKAEKDNPEHAIYASSFRKTGLAYPLVWAPRNKDVPAENVTDRYAKKDVAKDDKPRLRVRVLQAGTAKRVAVPVSVAEKGDPKVVQSGTSRGETADANDFLEFVLVAGREYVVRVGDPVRAEKTHIAAAGPAKTLEIELPEERK